MHYEKVFKKLFSSFTVAILTYNNTESCHVNKSHANVFM